MGGRALTVVLLNLEKGSWSLREREQNSMPVSDTETQVLQSETAPINANTPPAGAGGSDDADGRCPLTRGLQSKPHQR